jgi:hypothetical protein
MQDFPQEEPDVNQNNVHNFSGPANSASSFRFLHKCRCQQLCSVPRILSAVDLAVVDALFAAHVSLHVSDVVELGNVAVFLHVRTFVLGHRGDEVFDNFIGDERMAEIEFCDVWLQLC